MSVVTESVHADVNYRSVYAERGTDLSGTRLLGMDASAYDAILKISHSSDIVGNDVRVALGNENSVDIDYSDGVTLRGRFGLNSTEGQRGRGDQVITIKGGCRGVRVEGVIENHGTRQRVDVDIGNWFDQNYGLNRSIVVDLVTTDGSPVNVRVGWAVPFTVHLKGDCKYDLLGSIELKAYWLFKYAVRVALRIPKGTKGPAWL